jgi:hypothetical protein
MGSSVEGIDLQETLDALRAELGSAVERAARKGVVFPVRQVELEFHVGVTKTGDGKAGIRFWVVELGAGRSHATESIQRVKLTLDPPVDSEGNPVAVAREADYKP